MATRQSRTKAASTSKADDGKPDFEAAMKELETVVATLEKGDTGLDESLRQFERGVTLTRVCQNALREAEQKVETLLKNGDVKPYSSEE